jgi:hypothetical protein
MEAEIQTKATFTASGMYWGWDCRVFQTGPHCSLKISIRSIAAIRRDYRALLVDSSSGDKAGSASTKNGKAGPI